MSEFRTTPLERGGVLVEWGDFHLQVGAYPETIKDTMARDPGVPQLYLLPDQLFDVPLGVSVAELEFPLYYNYYIRGQKLRFVCRRSQLRPVVQVLKEALFGPPRLDLESEYPQGARSFGFPDLPAEMYRYKLKDGKPVRLRDMAEPVLFNEQGQVEVDGVNIWAMGDNRFRLARDGVSHLVIFNPVEPPPVRPDAVNRYQPVDFGVTVLGAGHGFDAETLTSGFIVWLNGRGVLVDPPVHSTEWLRRNGIDARLIADIVLTHCHADHDSGTLQKILEEGRIRLHTTPTVMESFIRKYRAVTGLSADKFGRLFDFHPVMVGQPINIAGGQFLFRYNLHPIPTLGFVVRFQGRRFAYSCDTLYDPKTIREWADDGILSPSRKEDLLNFDWEADLILHEAGIPPIHTPLDVLAELPDVVKKRLYVTHVSPSSVPPETGLRVAPTGLENTIKLFVDPPDVSLAHQMLDVLVHTDLFRSLPIEKSLDFLRIARPKTFQAREQIIRKGDLGECFYVVQSGEAEVIRDGTVVKVLGRYDYFGEMAIVLDQPRYADVVARSRVEVIMIDRLDFLQFIANTEIPSLLRQVARNKMTDAWPVMSANRHFRPLTTFQKTQLLAILQTRQFAEGEALYRIGGLPLQLFLIADGEVLLRDEHKRKLKVGRGTLLGRIPEEGQMVTHRVEAVAASPSVRVFQASLKQLARFFQSNPGTFIRIQRAIRESPFGTTQ
ncbi:MAG: cyclic nucleotide-binding domain-containing protein [Candidatus Eremiobacteraeota bacterium]|nr:cyclic nucleotide-binding domain-containing protein [Candidatus Eremiobacteraeota bacterium]